MEEESGALEVEDGGAESSDSPAEVRETPVTLSHSHTFPLSHFSTFTLSHIHFTFFYFHTFTLSHKQDSHVSLLSDRTSTRQTAPAAKVKYLHLMAERGSQTRGLTI